MKAQHVAMLLSNAFRPDPRVLKEALSLAELGYQVTIICWDRNAEMAATETLAPNVEIRRIQHVRSTYGVGARQLLRLPRFWRAATALLNQLQPDLVHCHDFDTLPAGLLWGKRHRRPVIYDAHEYYADLCKPRLHGPHGYVLYHLIRFAEQVGARLASAVITVDEKLGNIYRQLNRQVVIVGHYPSRTLVPNAAPVFTHPELTLLYVGRLSVDRGLLTYVDILHGLRALGIPAQLRLAGVFTAPQDEQMVRELCQDLPGALDIVGWVHYNQLPTLFQTADIGLSLLQPEPRYVEALPVKLFEYMAAGLPVLASNFPAIAAIFAETQCGQLVDPDDIDSAVETIQAWWQDPPAARQIGLNGRAAILQRYNWESLIAQVDQLYRSLL